MAEVDHPKMIILEGSETDQELLEEALQGAATPDVCGKSSTTEFIDEVVLRVTSRLEVWVSVVRPHPRGQHPLSL